MMSTREHHSTAFNKGNTETFATFLSVSLFLFTDNRDHTASNDWMCSFVQSANRYANILSKINIAALREWLMNQP